MNKKIKVLSFIVFSVCVILTAVLVPTVNVYAETNDSGEPDFSYGDLGESISSGYRTTSCITVSRPTANSQYTSLSDTFEMKWEASDAYYDELSYLCTGAYKGCCVAMYIEIVVSNADGKVLSRNLAANSPDILHKQDTTTSTDKIKVSDLGIKESGDYYYEIVEIPVIARYVSYSNLYYYELVDGIPESVFPSSKYYAKRVPFSVKLPLQTPTLKFGTTTSVSKNYVSNGTYTNSATSSSDGKITYKSSNTSVATVSTTGVVTYKGVGVTTITASVPQTSKYKAASVSYQLTINKGTTTLKFADSAPTVELSDINYTNKLTRTGDGKITYTSSNTSVATVDSYGKLTLKGKGSATIKATAASTSLYNGNTASYTVKVDCTKHVYGNVTIIKRATTTEQGLKESKCTYCGVVKKTTIPVVKWVTYSDGRKRYRSPEGDYEKGWKKIDGVWYYFDSAGYMVKGWAKVGGVWYYMNSSGAMTTGWQRVGGTWYYMSSSGAMTTGWQKIGGTWYYMNSSGAMLTGWQKIGGTWYYMNSSGAMLTGWQQIGGKWYYLNSDGSMAANKWIGNYYVDGNGVWVKSR